MHPYQNLKSIRTKRLKIKKISKFLSQKRKRRLTTVANKQKLDEVIVIGTSLCWWCSHRFISKTHKLDSSLSLSLSLSLCKVQTNPKNERERYKWRVKLRDRSVGNVSKWSATYSETIQQFYCFLSFGFGLMTLGDCVSLRVQTVININIYIYIYIQNSAINILSHCFYSFSFLTQYLLTIACRV